MINFAIVSDSFLVGIFIVQAFLFHEYISFTIPCLTPSRLSTRDNGMGSSSEIHGRPHQPFYRHIQMHNKGDGVGESELRNNSENRTGGDDTLFFADEDCYDLCELVEDEVEDVFLSVLPTMEIKHKDSIEDDYSRNDVVTSSDSPTTTLSSSSFSVDTNEKSVEKVRANVELRWSIDEDECNLEDASTCSDKCDECGGTGVLDCNFCNGTGWIDFGKQTPGTMGERLVERNGGVQGTECPVCNDDCEQTCQKCKGNGWISRWRMRNFSNHFKP